MNIGIYGDSFACHLDKPYTKHGIRKSWVDYIRDQHAVTNYSLEGSNLSFTHDKVLNHHKSHDINIVLVTHAGRLYLPNLSIPRKYCPSINYAEDRLTDSTDENDIAIFKAAKDYFIYIENEYETFKLHNLMVDDIRARVPNVILVPCFSYSISPTKRPSLFDIHLIDNKYYKLDRHAIDKKRCHLNDNNNVILGCKMIEHIENNYGSEFKIDLNDYVEPIGEPVDYNFGIFNSVE